MFLIIQNLTYISIKLVHVSTKLHKRTCMSVFDFLLSWLFSVFLHQLFYLSVEAYLGSLPKDARTLAPQICSLFLEPDAVCNESNPVIPVLTDW